jgi:metallo-beta-lactamase class B
MRRPAAARLLAAAAGVCLAGLLAGCTNSSPATPAPPPGAEAFYASIEPFPIVGPIHYVGTQDLGAYLITTPAGHILLDGAMPGSGPAVADSIRKLGFRVEDVRILLCTHAHCDHVGTSAYLREASGAQVVAMGPDVELLQSGGTTDYLYADVPAFHFDPLTVDRVLHDGDTVELGDLVLTARHTPGHTPGCTTWITSVQDGGRSYLVVFPGSTSINPGTHLVRDPSYAGIADDYRRALAVQESLHPDIWLGAHASFWDLPGKHERAATEGVQAWVDPDGYRRAIAERRQAVEAAIASESAAR